MDLVIWWLQVVEFGAMFGNLTLSSSANCEVSFPHYTNRVEGTNVDPFGLLSWLSHDDMLSDLLDLYPGI